MNRISNFLSVSSSRLELKDIDFKGEKASINARGYVPNGYTIFAEFNPAESGFTKEDFAELIKMLIKEKSSKISIKYLKIEEK